MATSGGSPRSARCPLDGRVYDSWSEAGCPDCAARAKRLPAPPPRRSGVPAALLLLAAVAAAAHWQGLLPRLTNRVEAQRRFELRSSAPNLDPAPYRAEIEAIEAVLYRDTQAEWADGERVAAAARELADHMTAELDRITAHAVLLRLSAFAMEAEANADAGYALPDLARSRRAWQRLRSELFAPAPWLRREGPDLAAVQNPAPRRADWLDIGALERFAKALDPLLASGRREMLAFGEVYVDVPEGSPEEAQLVDDWLAFARRWDERVTKACGQAPARPALDDDLRVVMAHQLLGDACHQLHVATVSAGEASVPMKHWRSSSLDQAAARIAEARAQLAEARRF